MTDKELLKLAATAAGFTHLTKWSGAIQDYDSPHCGEPALYEDGPGGECCSWNPLIDDGDALHLAAVLGMKIGILHGEARSTYVSRWINDGRGTTIERHGKDMMAATRRAIVREAAEGGPRKE